MTDLEKTRVVSLDGGDWCDVCDKKIYRGGLINWKTGLRCHVKCGRKIGAYNE